MHTSLRLGLGFAILSLVPLFVSAAVPIVQRSDAVGVELGRSVDYHFVAIGNVTQFSARGLPTGVTIDAGTGLLHGTPAEVGIYPIVVTATNADGGSSATITLSVVAADAAPLIYAPLTVDAFNEPRSGGDSFSCTFKATGAPTGYAVTATLPTNWSFANGTLVGRTTQPGLYAVPVSATNGYGTGSAAVTVRIHGACTQLAQTSGELRAGDVFRVTLQFNRAVSFSGPAPYLEFHTYPNGATRRIEYVSGNGTSTFEFAYTVKTDDAPGDILLYTTIQPANNGGVDGVKDADDLTLGAALPISGPYTPVASIAPAPTGGASVATTSGGASSGSTSTSTASATASTPTPSTATTSGGASSGASAAATSSTVAGSAGATASAGATTSTGTTTSTGANSSSGAATGAVTTESTSTTVTASNAVATDTSSGGGRLINLSARAAVAAGDSAHSFIAGFVVSGSQPKRMLLRAVGPALTEFGVGNALANPRLKIYDQSGKVVSENDDWSGGEISSTGSAVGAFGLSAGSRDAALAVTLAPGSYSMEVVPGAGSGVALAEIYDADTSAGSAPLINISTRAYVEGGEKSLVAGFVVGGNSPKRVLVRGVGPALSAYGVSGVLTDPAVKIYQAGAVVAENDNWQSGATASEVAAAGGSVGAFPLAAGSRDAALIATLPPGSYSAVVNAANGGTGAGLVEVYELK